MKTSLAILSVGLFLSGVAVEQAAAMGAAGPSSSMYANNVAPGMSLQIVGGGQSYELARKGLFAGSVQQDFDAAYLVARVGYDMRPWCTIYSSLGMTSADMDGTTIDSDTGMRWDLGTYLNLWQQDIEEPHIIASTLGLTVNSQVSGNYVDGPGSADVTWHDWITSLVLSIDVPNDGYSPAQQRLPASATYYVGPIFAYTDLSVDAPGVSFKSQSEFGVVGGLAVNITRQFSLIGEYRHIDEEAGFVATIAYKF